MLASVMSQLVVLFLMVGIGFFLRRKGFVSQHFQNDLAELILWVALPCSIVESGVLEAGGNLIDVAWMAGLSILSYILIILLAEAVRRGLAMPEEKGSLFCSMVVFANTAFVGYPVCSLLLGSKGVFYCSIFNMAFSIFFFTYGVRKISGKAEGGVKTVFMRDPGMIATVIMLLAFWFQWQPMALVRTFLAGMSSLCTPLSMLVIGSMLTEINMREVIHEKSYYIITVMRLSLAPLLILALLSSLIHLGIDKDILFVIIIMCAMPAGSLTAIYAQKYQKDISFVSGGIIHTMVCFCISLPAVILLARWVLYR